MVMISKMSSNFYSSLASIHKTALHCKNEGIPLPEKLLRSACESGTLPAIKTGKKYLILWDNVLAFVRNGTNQSAAEEASANTKGGGIRRVVE